jgi:flagellar basal body-associated protein FliL
MEGGVALLLLLIIIVVGGVIAIAMYLTGGALTLSRDKEARETKKRPEHKEVTSPELEHTNFGTRSED